MLSSEEEIDLSNCNILYYSNRRKDRKIIYIVHDLKTQKDYIVTQEGYNRSFANEIQNLSKVDIEYNIANLADESYFTTIDGYFLIDQDRWTAVKEEEKRKKIKEEVKLKEKAEKEETDKRVRENILRAEEEEEKRKRRYTTKRRSKKEKMEKDFYWNFDTFYCSWRIWRRIA